MKYEGGVKLTALEKTTFKKLSLIRVNIQNIDDNECFKESIVRYLNPADHHPARHRKADKDFAKKLDFKDIKFPDIHTHKKNYIDISIFGYENKKKNSNLCIKKNVLKKNMFNYY